MPLLPCHCLTWSREQCLQSHAPCRQTVQEMKAGILLPALSDVPSNSWNSRGICPTGGKLDSSFLICTWGTSISVIVSSSADLKAEDLLHTRSRSLSFDHLYSGLWMKAFRAQLQHTLKYSWAQPRTITKRWLESRSSAGGCHTATSLALVGKQQFTQAKNVIFFAHGALLCKPCFDTHLWAR